MPVDIYHERMFYRFALYGFLKNLKFYEPFIILYFLSVGLSYAMIGALVSIHMISTTLLELPTGIYADAFGRKKSMLMSFSSYITSFIIFFFFRDFYVFATTMVLYALGDAFRIGTHKAMILEYLRINDMKDKKVEYYGHTRAASQFGSAVNSLTAAAIVFYTGDYAIIFLVAIIPYMIDILNVGTYPTELDGERKKGMMRGQLYDTLKAFAGMFRNRNAMKGILNSSFSDGSFEVSKNYLQPIVKSFALSMPVFLFLTGEERTAIVIGMVYFFIYVLTSLASKNSHKIMGKIGKLPLAINVTFIGSSLIILMTGVFLIGTKQTGINYLILLSIVLFLLLYLFKNLRRPMNVSYISDQISHRTMASGLSAESLMKALIAGILAPLIGYAADLYGVGIALAILGLLAVSFYPIAHVE
ncbi:MAG: MFS transporter [Candidatus Thermoplasmatota archaeon]|nr:MFS transporter [Candidatus Thermoplasmatota archaeon]